MQNDREKFKNEFKKRLYSFVLRLVRFIGTLNLKDPVCRAIADQLARSGTSILSNYIEGHSASSRKEFTVFFNYSLKSSNESRVWVSILKDSSKCNQKEAEWLLQELSEIAKIFASSILTLRGKKF